MSHVAAFQPVNILDCWNLKHFAQKEKSRRIPMRGFRELSQNTDHILVNTLSPRVFSGVLQPHTPVLHLQSIFEGLFR